MENIYVKIIDEVPYQMTKEWYDVELSPEEWLALDLTKKYAIVDGVLTEITQQTPVQSESSLVPPPSLEFMYSQAGCGVQEQIEAMWSLVVYQDRTKVDAFETKRKEVQEEHKRKTKEYEGKK